MVLAEITTKDNQDRFTVGDTVSGTVRLTLPSYVPLSDVTISLNCLGEVKWIEDPGTMYYLNGHVYCDKIDFHEEVLKWSEKDVTAEKHGDSNKYSIPFSFVIPDDKNLPSTMFAHHGFIQHFVCVAIKTANKETSKFIKQIAVQSPISENLMITVGGSAGKEVLLHNGTVSMHVSIGRKGFVAGESISVHVSMDNQTDAVVKPRVCLHQIQIYQCQNRHRALEYAVSKEPMVGAEVQPHTKSDQVLDVAIPSDQALTIKSPVISVKYFVQVVLDIPQSFDLQINLPVVLTSHKVLEQLHGKKDLPERIAN